MQPYLPQLLHGHTNMESGIISLHERKWPIPRIAKMFKITPTVVKKILTKFGYLRLEEESARTLY